MKKNKELKTWVWNGKVKGMLNEGVEKKVSREPPEWMTNEMSWCKFSCLCCWKTLLMPKC